MNGTILIVDDMMLNIDMLSSILGDDYTVMAAVSGEDAIKLMQRKTPDLVLLDVSMPEIDGFDVLRFMKGKKELSGIPVIFVTGEYAEQSEEKGLMLGAVDYIKKPYNATVVRVKVQNHLELKAYRDNLEHLVSKRTEQLMERTKQLDASRESIIMGMSLMSESHDRVTGAHIKRIKEYTRILTRKIQELYPDLITPELAEQIVLFSPLHDVGKVGISDIILNKPGVLTPEEFDTMKTHTTKGAALLRQTETFLSDSKETGDLKTAIEIAEYHHERYDGRGYPQGLQGDEIPLSARIVALADVYDALRSERPYKKAFTHQEAIDIIVSGDKRSNSSHFDPRVIESFNSVLDEFAEVNHY